MFSLFRSKRHDPRAIARAVLRATRDPDLITLFWKEFTSYERPIPARLLFSMVVFAYCWARGWSATKNDVRVSAAYEQAALIIASQFRDASKLVLISDYVLSQLEIAELSVRLIEQFRQHLPPSTNQDADTIQAMLEACRCHQIPLETLLKMIIPIRNERMIRELSNCLTSNLSEPDMLRIIADTLYEQVSGVGPLDLCRDPSIMTEGQLSFARSAARAEVVLPLLSRLDAELEAL